MNNVQTEAKKRRKKTREMLKPKKRQLMTWGEYLEREEDRENKLLVRTSKK